HNPFRIRSYAKCRVSPALFGKNSRLCNSFPFTSFADTHPLNSFVSYRCKNMGRGPLAQPAPASADQPVKSQGLSYFLTSFPHSFLLSSTIAAPLSGGEMSFSQRFDEVRTGFERPFWVANVTELFERLSYYAAFASLARYLHETLAFPTERATDLAGLFGGLVWFLAIFGGAIADRLGFRRALSLAYFVLAGSYFLLVSLGAPWLA